MINWSLITLFGIELLGFWQAHELNSALVSKLLIYFVLVIAGLVKIPKPNILPINGLIASFFLAFTAFCLPIRWQAGFLLGILHTLVFYAAGFFSQSRVQRREQLASVAGIQVAFFISGFAALIYQVVWQRRLIEFLGANSQSVSIIIGIFMAGLGLGSLLADWLLLRLTRFGLIIFCLFELGIGVMGITSLPLLDYLSHNLVHIPESWELAGLVAIILFPPTILMGATLPVLVALLKNYIPNFHANVGRLYAVNAFGSAIAAVLTALILFNLFGQSTNILFASLCNALTVFMIWQGASQWHTNNQISNNLDPEYRSHSEYLSWPLIVGFTFFTGLISLSQEVLLIKVISWQNGGRAYTFGIGVGAFLLGLALGSWKQIELPSASLRIHATRNWLYASAIFSSIPFAASYLFVPELTEFMLIVCLAGCGFFGARTLPMVAGLLNPNDQAKFGRIVTANILGSVAGAMLVGNLLLDHLSLAGAFLITSILGFVITLLLGLASYLQYQSWQKLWNDSALVSNMSALIILVVSFCVWPIWAPNWLERLLFCNNSAAFLFQASTKSGIVGVHQEGNRKVVYGGGVYDGAINTLPVPNVNGITRLYRVLGMHDAPKEVLEIGLSSGSWARVISADPRVEHLTSIEINPAYLGLVQNFPEVAPILNDHKVSIEIDDGRRWLRSHPDRKFDMIVSNTSFHWRAGITLITSQEFFSLVAKSLKPGGIFTANTTFSPNIITTARRVFPYVATVDNFIVSSFSPLNFGEKSTLARLQAHPFLSESAQQDGIFQTKVENILSDPPNSVPIRDDLMNEEFGNRPER